MQVGCETTTLDSIARACSTPQKCATTKIQTQTAKKLMYLFTADLKEHQFFHRSELTDTDKIGTNLRLQVFPENLELRQKIEKLYKTKIASLFVEVSQNQQ